MAAVVCVLVSLRAVARLSPRALLTAQSLDGRATPDARGARRNRLLAALLLRSPDSRCSALGFAQPSAQAGAFFGAARRCSSARCSWLSAWLRARDTRAHHRPRHLGGGAPRIPQRRVPARAQRAVGRAHRVGRLHHRFGRRVPARGRRADGRSEVGNRRLRALRRIRAAAPAQSERAEPAARRSSIQAPELAQVRFTRFRVRPGEDASCLNLYRPTNPTIVAPEAGFIESNRFTFASSMAETDAERANPWLLLRRQFDDGAIPVIADATSLQYVLHVGVGDTFSIDTGGERPLVLRFVGALRDSVLQGELVVSEEAFVRLFPQQQGYRLFLVDAPSVTLDRRRQDACRRRRTRAAAARRRCHGHVGAARGVPSRREHVPLDVPGARRARAAARDDRAVDGHVPQRARAASRARAAARRRLRHAPDDAHDRGRGRVPARRRHGRGHRMRRDRDRARRGSAVAARCRARA